MSTHVRKNGKRFVTVGDVVVRLRANDRKFIGELGDVVSVDDQNIEIMWRSSHKRVVWSLMDSRGVNWQLKM